MPNQTNENTLWSKFVTFDNFLLAWQRLANVTSRMVSDEVGKDVFAFNLHDNLQDLVERVNSETDPYQPYADNKVYVPKPSTTMRTMSMMCVPDLVVYQAMANTIADACHHYLVTHENQHVWGNIYAGQGSPWMLKSWKYQYNNFVDEVVRIFNDGSTWIASTDIVSFYDTIDHQTLFHFVKKYADGDSRFVSFFEQCLAKWAAHNTDTSMSRGIPQGCNASDFLANLYLYEIDQHMIVKGYQYTRYVDDIRILSKDKSIVQRGLIDFDLELKRYGLVAQVSKTSVHQIEDIEKEISRLKFWVTDPTDSTTHEDETSLPQSEQASSVRDFIANSGSDDALEQVIDGEEDADQPTDTVSTEHPTVDENTSAESVQNQLHEQFLEAYAQLDDPEKGKEANTKITYCLNRLFRRDDIREHVISLLDKIPWRSESVTRYLALFKGDSIVIEHLTEFVNTHEVYQWHRANALQALAEIAGAKYVAPTCRHWLSNELQQWYPKTIAAQILMRVPRQHSFFIECLRREQTRLVSAPGQNVVLRQQLALAAFKTAKSKGKHKTLFELILRPDESTLLRRLGVYLLQQKSCSVTWVDLEPFHQVLGEYAALIETLGISPDVPRPCFILQSVRQLFNINVAEDSLRRLYGRNYDVAAGHLRKSVEFFYSSNNDFVRNFHQFAHVTLVAFHEYVLPASGNPLAMEYGSLWQHAGFKVHTPNGSKAWEILGELRNRVDHPVNHKTRFYSERIKNNEVDNIKRQLSVALQELYEAWIAAPIPTPPTPPSPVPTAAAIPTI